MFAVKDIKRSLTWIFSLFDEEDIACLMLDDDDVVSELTPELLSRKYRRDARHVKMFCSSTGPEDEGSWSGSLVFKKKAVWLCAVDSINHTTSKLRVKSFTELWLLSNMKFAKVHCVCAIVLNKGKAVSATECRSFVKYVRKPADLFVDAETLFNELDDTALFEQLLGGNNLPCDF